jgi:hypothetical protein
MKQVLDEDITKPVRTCYMHPNKVKKGETLCPIRYIAEDLDEVQGQQYVGEV